MAQKMVMAELFMIPELSMKVTGRMISRKAKGNIRGQMAHLTKAE